MKLERYYDPTIRDCRYTGTKSMRRSELTGLRQVAVNGGHSAFSRIGMIQWVVEK